MKRIKLKAKKPNPLFEVWLEEWKEKAASRNSDLQYHFSKALASLRKYPLPLKSGKECIILQHFGTKLCSMLDRKLKQYKAENEDLLYSNELVSMQHNYNEEYTFKRKTKSQRITVDVDFMQKRTELVAFNNLNLSSWSLQNYACLLILYKKIQDVCCSGYITEVDLLSEIQKLCGSASKTLVSDLFNDGLISMIGAPIRYNLTEHGISVSKKICEVADVDIKLINSSEILNKIQVYLKSTVQKSELIKSANIQVSNKYLKDKQNKDSSKSVRLYKSKSAGLINIDNNRQQFDKNSLKEKSKDDDLLVNKVQEKVKKTKNVNNGNNLNNNKTDSIDDVQKKIYLESTKFEIILLVDTQETCGGKTKPQHDATIVELTKLDVLFEIRHLKVGDFAWIARCKSTNNELILPYIVERKRIDDLSASITDGRFHEQKFRLKQSGITNLMYIIEEYERGQRLTIPHSSLMQASINTLIQDSFSVKYTKNHKDSMFYLSSLTRVLIKAFKDKNLTGCTKEAIAQTDISSRTHNLMVFGEFNKAASKQKDFKVSEMFVRQLLQLKGMSIDKALAIVERYPTPRILVEAFQQADYNGELLLANIEFGNKKRLIGPVVSKTIYQLYTKKQLN